MTRPSHICQVPGCNKLISRHHLCCMAHWMKVPADLRTKVTMLYSRVRNTVVPDSPHTDAAKAWLALRDEHRQAAIEAVNAATRAAA